MNTVVTSLSLDCSLLKFRVVGAYSSFNGLVITFVGKENSLI